MIVDVRAMFDEQADFFATRGWIRDGKCDQRLVFFVCRVTDGMWVRPVIEKKPHRIETGARA